MRRSARTDLCGGRSVMIVPTASLMSSRAEFAQSSTYENIYCFHQRYEMYAKLTAATIVRITRQPPKRACQYVPIAIPKVNIPNLKRPVCHHFNVKVLKIFMRRAFLRTKNLNEFYSILLQTG
jgi:hypothetical protein